MTAAVITLIVQRVEGTTLELAPIGIARVPVVGERVERLTMLAEVRIGIVGRWRPKVDLRASGLQWPRIVMRSSSDWLMTSGGWQRAELNKTRGLNRNYNRRLKCIFKGAATAVLSHRIEPLYAGYTRMTEQGTKPPMAKLTLARKIAATVLAMWKNQEVYDPQKHRDKG